MHWIYDTEIYLLQQQSYIQMHICVLTSSISPLYMPWKIHDSKPELLPQTLHNLVQILIG